MKSHPILDRVKCPQDLKSLSFKELKALAKEIRGLIMQVVSENGGHLASNLGAVELTLSLHRVFESPRDKIIWDVGHQCYTHKLITGRRDRFSSLRQFNGLSGFPKRSESPHDIVETGHASTALSAALGILLGQRRLKQKGKVLAVIGDGSLTGGVALEALNQIGHLRNDLIVILNDNKMSIGDNVGAISFYLSRLTATHLYQTFREKFDKAVQRIPIVGKDLIELIYRFKKGFKAVVLQDSLFSDLGYDYIGPIDGHNVRLLIRTLRDVKKMNKPTVVHVATIKGKGYRHAEGDPTLYHGVSPFSIIDGKIESKDVLTFTEAFSKEIARLGSVDNRIVGITAAMADGTGLRLFETMFPNRFFDVGIAEQHAVTFAAGLATAGLKPVVAIYSTFMQRAVDQVIHDVALPGLPVIFAVDRAGVVGADGETHQGVFDIPLFRSVPGLTMIAPSNHQEMELMLRYAVEESGPVMIRYPKSACGPDIDALNIPMEQGRGVLIHPRQGEVLIISVGGILSEVLQAAEILRRLQIETDVYSLRFIRPLDEAYLLSLLSQYGMVCLCEEGYMCGGIGERVAALMKQNGLENCFLHIGIPDRLIPQGKRPLILQRYGLDAPHIAAAVEQTLISQSAVRFPWGSEGL